MTNDIKDAVIIYNPTSGRRRHRRFTEVEEAARILTQAGIRTELTPTTAPATATEIARLACERNRGMIIGCGGDGTINEIVNGMAGSRVPLALLPAGTANILAKELGIPWDIPSAARLIPSGTCRRIALGMVTPTADQAHAEPQEGAGHPAGRYFLCVAGAGPDGAIVNAVDEGVKTKAGILAYWAAGIRQLFKYSFPEIRVASAHGHNLNATIIVVGRTAHYGGPFKITTEANLFEDSFELLVNTTRSRMKYLACLPALWLGRLRKIEGIHAWKAREVTCWPANGENVYAQADGEAVGKLPLRFQIVPDALTVVVPSKA